jgi:hypothetical protein
MNFSGVQLLDSDSAGITMELEMQWDGNPNIVLDIQTTLGISLPVQVIFNYCNGIGMEKGLSYPCSTKHDFATVYTFRTLGLMEIQVAYFLTWYQSARFSFSNANTTHALSVCNFFFCTVSSRYTHISKPVHVHISNFSLMEAQVAHEQF